MNRKAFTLIELLAVLVVLALIAAIVFPAVTSTLKDTREKAYESQIKIIEKAAKVYFLDNTDKLPEDTTKCVSLETLIDSGYIADEELSDGNVINPKTNSPLIGVVQVVFTSKQYAYSFTDDYTTNDNNECIERTS